MTRPRGLTLARETYPSGTPYILVQVDGSTIGTVEITNGGLYLPSGCRKPAASQAEAVRRLMAAKAKGLRREADRIEAVMGEGIGEQERGSQP